MTANQDGQSEDRGRKKEKGGHRAFERILMLRFRVEGEARRRRGGERGKGRETTKRKRRRDRKNE